MEPIIRRIYDKPSAKFGGRTNTKMIYVLYMRAFFERSKDGTRCMKKGRRLRPEIVVYERGHRGMGPGTK